MENIIVCRASEITKELLDSIVPGDKVKVNDWESFLTVKAVSKNYFVMVEEPLPEHNADIVYSICEKLQRSAFHYHIAEKYHTDSIPVGKFHVSTDGYLFGHPLCLKNKMLYRFETPETNEAYLQTFESGQNELSYRNSMPIDVLYLIRKQEKSI